MAARSTTPTRTGVSARARIRADRPGVTETEVAEALGISPSRWRTIRKGAPPA